jgi:hypothetical protein
VSLAVLAPLRVGLHAADSGSSSVSGRVLETGTGAPVRSAMIYLRRWAVGGTYSAATGSDGAFSFRNVPADEYGYSVSLDDLRYLPDLRGRASKLLRIGDGESVSGLRWHATPRSSLSGRVFDDQGEPLQRAIVSAIRQEWLTGERRWVKVKSSETNDQGEYSLAALEPGLYCVFASGRLGLSESFFEWQPSSTVRQGRGEKEMVLAGAFYPGTAAIARAKRIDLDPGRNVGGIDLHLPLDPAYHIRGSVDRASIGPTHNLITQTADYVSASLFEDGQDSDWGGYTALVDDDGTFDVAVPSGTYYLERHGNHGAQTSRISAVTVAGSDVTGVELSSKKVSVRIRAQLEGGPSTDLGGIILAWGLADHPGTATWHTYANGDTWTDELWPGRYRMMFSVYAPATPYHVRDALLGGSKQLQEPLVDLRSGNPIELDVVLHKGAEQTLAGAIDMSQGDNYSTAVFVPEGPGLGAREVTFAGIDQRGAFLVFAAPGKYRAYAVEEFDWGLWENPKFTGRMSEFGAAVEVGDGRQKTETQLRIPGITAAKVDAVEAGLGQ